MKLLRKLAEKLMESLLTLSGAVTTAAVVLIFAYLFREGLGVFSESPVESRVVLAVHGSNPVKQLNADVIRKMYDGQITNWKEAGGSDVEVVPFYQSDITKYFSDSALGPEFANLPQCIGQLIDSMPGIIAAFDTSYTPAKFAGHYVQTDQVSLISFLSGRNWYPTAKPAAQYGALPLLLGSLWVCIAAILIALPLGLAAAIYISEIAQPRVRRILKPMVELLAGIPSVVYGFFGLMVVVPAIQRIFNLEVGETGLAGSVLLAIMALPAIISVSEDALRSTPREMKEASLALGATQWQTIWRVVLPWSSSGIAAAAVLGIGRAVGETMAVLMVTGNAAVIPHSLLEPVRTLPATIAGELGEAAQGGTHSKALFALGCLLFLITLTFNLLVEYLVIRRRRAAGL
ncbi:MAG: phosphate ABC transporter permease subunit PstC [Bacteroidia bacterium]|jgi:phosphate transport system permease protein|nr:phosphate ABC transporter permease subunit PstC [Bacteroidia bacterium]